jgi:hypothetical protein
MNDSWKYNEDEDFSTPLLNFDSSGWLPPRTLHLTIEGIDDYIKHSNGRLLSALVMSIADGLTLDQNAPFRYRMDNKLMQAIHLTRFLPDVIPYTEGMAKLARQCSGTNLAIYANNRFGGEVVIKPVFGYASSREVVLSSSQRLSDKAFVDAETCDYTGSPLSEKFIIQSKLDIVREYRIHTLSRVAFRNLAFLHYGGETVIPGEDLEKVCAFAENCLCRLPPVFRDNLAAWDIAELRDGRFFIIEINYSGMHPTFDPGFHCSGHYQHPLWGAVNIANLLLSLKEQFGVDIEWPEVHGIYPEPEETRQLLYGIQEWYTLCEIAHQIHDLWCQTSRIRPGTTSSMRERIFNNLANPMDRKFQETIDWLKRMTDDLYKNA